MADEFKVGDVVVCVDASPSQNPIIQIAHYLRKGALYRVTGLEMGNYEPALRLEGIRIPDPMVGFSYTRFKHLPKADDTFINQMRSLKPAKEKTNVR